MHPPVFCCEGYKRSGSRPAAQQGLMIATWLASVTECYVLCLNKCAARPRPALHAQQIDNRNSACRTTAGDAPVPVMCKVTYADTCSTSILYGRRLADCKCQQA
jgi:hypothetical protein